MLVLPFTFVAALSLVYLLVSNTLARLCFAISAYLTVLMLSDVFDTWSWLFTYELSLLTVITPFTTEGRSYRKSYALLILLALSLLSTSLFVRALHSSTQANLPLPTATDTLCLLLALLIKTPTYPFSLWLPEAHVEASFAGSIVLAGYALKFSLFALLLFAATLLQKNDLILLLAALGGLSGTFAAVSTPDFKKFAANMSVAHMSMTLLLFAVQSQAVLKLTLLTWAHHSLIASWLFFLIGATYAVTGTRNVRHISQGFTIAPLWTAVTFLILTFSLDLPWSASAVTEISILALVHAEVLQIGFLVVLIVLFTGAFHALGKLYLHREWKPTATSYDLPATYSLTMLTAGIWTIVYAAL